MRNLLPGVFHLIAFLSLFLLSTAQTRAGAEPATFTFTAIPDQDQVALEKRFNQIADYLADELGVKVQYLPVKNYLAAIAAFRNNQVQLAWFGGLSGVRARQLVAGSKAIAQGEEDQHFVTYFVANKRTGIKPSPEFPKGIVGKTLTFGSKGSTSGRLMPEFYIRQHTGKAPDQLFTAVGFSGDHTSTLLQVQAGAYDVGVVNFKVWEKLLAEGKIDSTKLEVIWQTPEYTDYQWTIRGDADSHFGQGFSAKVQTALLQLTDPALLAQFPRSRFVPASNQDYQAIEDTAKAIGLLEE